MKFSHICFSLLLLNVSYALAQKKVINTIDDIPRFTYQIDEKASVVFNSDGQFKSLCDQLKKDYSYVLENYDFSDASVKMDFLVALKQIDFFDGKYDEALEKVYAIKKLESKQASTLTSGLTNIAYLKVIKNLDRVSNEFRSEFKNQLKILVDTLPYSLVQDDIKGAKGSFEMYSDNLLLGLIKENLDPATKKGKFSDDVASTLIWYKYTMDFIMPYREEVIDVYEDYLKKNYIKKKDIWKDRDVDISKYSNLTPITVAIMDSGIDEVLFPGQMFLNDNEILDGKDNDDNGFIDDVNGIAYDLLSDKSTGNLFPLTPEQIDLIPEISSNYKGLSDLQANVSSQEATQFKSMVAGLSQEAVKEYVENIGLYGIYAHGTHVAGIATMGNPATRLMVARITFDYRMIPMAPTVELYRKGAIQAKETMDYFRANGVRIVNMSFGESPESVEGALEMNGIGETAEERKKLAREMFDIGKEAFYSAIESSPEILFVAAAGNEDTDSEFYEFIPSSFNLPNIITVGAVDQAGDKTSFTSFGKNVDVHANGFEVESFVPGGERFKLSGTSMAAPNVANLAGKLLAIKPDLSVDELIKLIINNCDPSKDAQMNLINPKKSIEAVLKL